MPASALPPKDSSKDLTTAGLWKMEPSTSNQEAEGAFAPGLFESLRQSRLQFRMAAPVAKPLDAGL